MASNFGDVTELYSEKVSKQSAVYVFMSSSLYKRFRYGELFGEQFNLFFWTALYIKYCQPLLE